MTETGRNRKTDTNEITVATLQFLSMFLCLLWASVLIFSMLMQFNEVHLRLRSIEAIWTDRLAPLAPSHHLTHSWIQTQPTEYMLKVNGSLSFWLSCLVLFKWQPPEKLIEGFEEETAREQEREKKNDVVEMKEWGGRCLSHCWVVDLALTKSGNNFFKTREKGKMHTHFMLVSYNLHWINWSGFRYSVY